MDAKEKKVKKYILGLLECKDALLGKQLLLGVILLFFCSTSAVAQQDSEALWDAIRNNDFSKTQSILLSGADPNKKFKNGKTPVQIARSRNILALLVSAGGVLTTSGASESLIEHYARLSRDHLTTPEQSEEYLRMIKFLLERGETISPVAAAHLGKVNMIRDQIVADPSWIYSKESMNVAITFVECENLEGLRLLLVGGLNANWTVFENGYCTLPLLLHSTDKPVEFAKLLCLSGADVNAKIHVHGGRSGPPMGNDFTVLHSTAKLGSPKLTQLLIDFQAEVNSTDSLGRTPLFYAVYFSADAALKDRYANENNNLQRYMETIRILFDNGGLADLKDVNDESPLTLLDTMNIPDAVKALFPEVVHPKNNSIDPSDDGPPER